MLRKQAGELEYFAFRRRESGAFVEVRRVEQGSAFEGTFFEALGREGEMCVLDGFLGRRHGEGVVLV